GMGLERTLAVINETEVFSTDLFAPIIAKIDELSDHSPDLRAKRIIADHLRTAVFMIADGVTPLNTGRGYVLRRLIRRVVRNARKVSLAEKDLPALIETIIDLYQKIYPELASKREIIQREIEQEKEKAQKPLDRAEQFRIDLQEATKYGTIKKIKIFPILLPDGRVSADYIHQNYQTYGVPVDLAQDIITELGLTLEEERLAQLTKEHQEVSRVGSEQKFKGGLAGTGEMETKYHTATHLLLASLRQILKSEIVQKGSNITTERLRFDFNWPEKLSPEQLKSVEDLVNEKIAEKIPVEMLELPKDEALKLVGTLSFDLSKYGDIVKIYKIGSFSTEFCGGPHVTNTSDLGHFKITKEEASSAGVRRIKAVLE
ncbi:MAG: alanine--tRNA ligase-related protein, partial [Candidatus Paceibacterota bacterium]